jgi:hypothetical protein
MKDLEDYEVEILGRSDAETENYQTSKPRISPLSFLLAIIHGTALSNLTIITCRFGTRYPLLRLGKCIGKT